MRRTLAFVTAVTLTVLLPALAAHALPGATSPAPTVKITAPANSALVHGTVALAATVTASASPYTVVFDVDGVPLATSRSAPWRASWTTSGDGAHVVRATVTDARGRTATASVRVTVDNTSPQTAVVVPSSQWTYSTSPIAVQATASDASGVASVQFSLDGRLVGSPQASTSGTYSASIPVGGGTGSQHRVQSVAIDRAGNSATSAAVYFTLGLPPPTVSVAAPVDGARLHGIVAVTASVAGGRSPYTVRLVLDGKATGQRTTSSPYQLSWDTRQVASGSHTLQLSVTDAQGFGSTSSSVHVTVDNTPPAVAVVSPAGGSAVDSTFTASATATDAGGISSVQFAIDGTRTGPLLTAPDANGAYTTTLSLDGLPLGPHAITAIATDLVGTVATSAAVNVGLDTTPTVSITQPLDWSFGRGTSTVTAVVGGGQPPYTAQVIVDEAVVATVTSSTSPIDLSWDTHAVADGTHLVQVHVTDTPGLSASSPLIHVTVDNMPPTVAVYSPADGARVGADSVQLQVHASDAYGMGSVQFTLDGAPVGDLLTSPDGGTGYLYSYTLDLSSVAPGMHTVGSICTDAAGNVTTTSTSIKTGPLEYLPVLNYHEINPPNGYSVYDETPDQAAAELAYLHDNGYQSVTLAQYEQWLAGGDIGIAKPVLITVDDGLKSEEAWDPLLQQYGYTAVLFVSTGYADGTTPEDADPNNMTWADIQALAATGRWQIAFHAGEYGHGDSYGDGALIGTQGYAAGCPYFYSCLSSDGSVAETPDQLEAAVAAEIEAGQAELAQQVPGAATDVFAAPFNDAGQWTNLYNDPSGTVQAWLPGFLASKFSLVFTQTSPVLYGQASGLVGSLTAYNRRYRFEVHTDTTIEQFAAALTDPAFAR